MTDNQPPHKPSRRHVPRNQSTTGTTGRKDRYPHPPRSYMSNPDLFGTGAEWTPATPPPAGTPNETFDAANAAQAQHHAAHVLATHLSIEKIRAILATADPDADTAADGSGQHQHQAVASDTSSDASSDASPDASPDASSDASPDTWSDTWSDAWSDIASGRTWLTTDQNWVVLAALLDLVDTVNSAGNAGNAALHDENVDSSDDETDPAE